MSELAMARIVVLRVQGKAVEAKRSRCSWAYLEALLELGQSVANGSMCRTSAENENQGQGEAQSPTPRPLCGHGGGIDNQKTSE
jgi:hypothetical protein